MFVAFFGTLAGAGIFNIYKFAVANPGVVLKYLGIYVGDGIGWGRCQVVEVLQKAAEALQRSQS